MKKRIDLAKDKIAKEKGYPNWEEFENWIMDANDSTGTALILVQAMEEVCILLME